MFFCFKLPQKRLNIEPARLVSLLKPPSTASDLCPRLAFFPQVVLTSLEILKKIAIDGGASSLQSVELQMSLDEMMEMW